MATWRLLALCGLVLFTHTEATAANVCTGSITGNVLRDERNPATLEEAKRALPCGLTFIDDNNCLHDCTLGDCAIGVGHCTTADWVLFEWSSTDGMGGLPLPSECQAVMQSRTLCGCNGGSGGSPPLIDCPDPIASEDEDTIFGEGGAVDEGPRALTEAEAKDAGWAEPCRSYALMPEGWDEWTPARGFFAVGMALPIERYQWSGIDHRDTYGILTALVDSTRYSPILLGVIGKSPLWGGDEGSVKTDWEWLERQGICFWPQGTHLGSPYWLGEHMRDGGRNFPVLVRCDAPETDGFGLFAQKDPERNKLTEETWPATGTLAAELVPMMEGAKSYELVCVTAEVADLRRQLRKLGRTRDQVAEPSTTPQTTRDH